MGRAENPVQAAGLRLLAHWPGVLLSGRTNNNAVYDGRAWRKFNGIPGLADSLAWARPGAFPRGNMAAVEFKAPGKKPTPEQLTFLRAVASSGNTAIVCDDVGWLHQALEGKLEPDEDGIFWATVKENTKRL